MNSEIEELARRLEQRNHAWRTIAKAVDVLVEGGNASTLAFVLARVPRLEEDEEFYQVVEEKEETA